MQGKITLAMVAERDRQLRARDRIVAHLLDENAKLRADHARQIDRAREEYRKLRRTRQSEDQGVYGLTPGAGVPSDQPWPDGAPA